MSDFWEFAARMKKETDNWPQWKRAAGGLPPVNHDLLAERAPQPPADLVQATQDGEHGHVGACDVMHDIPGCFCGYEGLREALDAIEKETK